MRLVPKTCPATGATCSAWACQEGACAGLTAEAAVIAKATTTVVRWDPIDLSACNSLSEAIEARMRDALVKRVAAWERATLEMAFDDGLDVRTPWGPEIAEYAAATYKAWFNPPLTVVVGRGSLRGVSDYVG